MTIISIRNNVAISGCLTAWQFWTELEIGGLVIKVWNMVPFGGFLSHGGAPKWLVCYGKFHLEMDDSWGYPYDSGNHLSPFFHPVVSTTPVSRFLFFVQGVNPGRQASHWRCRPWGQAKDWMAKFFKMETIEQPIEQHLFFSLFFLIGSIVLFTTIRTFCVTFSSNIKLSFLLHNCPHNDKFFHGFVQTNYHPVKVLPVRRTFIFRLLHWSSETQTHSEVERKRMYI